MGITWWWRFGGVHLGGIIASRNSRRFGFFFGMRMLRCPKFEKHTGNFVLFCVVSLFQLQTHSPQLGWGTSFLPTHHEVSGLNRFVSRLASFEGPCISVTISWLIPIWQRNPWEKMSFSLGKPEKLGAMPCQPGTSVAWSSGFPPSNRPRVRRSQVMNDAPGTDRSWSCKSSEGPCEESQILRQLT